MSSALVRQALAFVDQEESKVKGKKRVGKSRNQNLVTSHPYKKNIKNQKPSESSKRDIVEENIKKLLALSTPTADKKVAEKIIERAVKGKPLADKIEVKVAEEKSILFPEESFETFEKKYFYAVLGKLISVTTLTVFSILVFWVNSYPFIDEDLAIYKYIPDPQWVLLTCAIWGLLFIGGLMSFTVYHIYPYL